MPGSPKRGQPGHGGRCEHSRKAGKGVRVNDGFVDDATLVPAAPVSPAITVTPAVWVAILAP